MQRVPGKSGASKHTRIGLWYHPRVQTNREICQRPFQFVLSGYRSPLFHGSTTRQDGLWAAASIFLHALFVTCISCSAIWFCGFAWCVPWKGCCQCEFHINKKIYILLTSNLGLVGHTRQFQKPMSSRLIQHWHFLLRPMSSGHNHDIHRNMYEVFKETAPSRTLCHHCVTRVPGSGI